MGRYAIPQGHGDVTTSLVAGALTMKEGQQKHASRPPLLAAFGGQAHGVRLFAGRDHNFGYPVFASLRRTTIQNKIKNIPKIKKMKPAKQ